MRGIDGRSSCWKNVDRVGGGHVRGDGKPAELDGEDDEEDDAGDELRERDERETGHRYEAIEELAVVQGRKHPKPDRERDYEEQCEAAEDERVLEAFADKRSDGRVQQLRFAPVTSDETADPLAVPDQKRPVVPKLVIQPLYLLVRRIRS
jgi:hypothetical protein